MTEGSGAARQPPRRDGQLVAFVGRERELAALGERLDAAARGTGCLVLIAGEPGIGKTRLLQEIAGRARAGGWLVRTGRAYDTEGMPAYLPFVEAIREHLDACPDEDLLALIEEAPAVATLIPQAQIRLAAPPPRQALNPEAERYRLFEAVSEFFLRAARSSGKSGVLLCLDDLHWADPSSLELLLHLSRKLSDDRFLVVATYRPEEVDASPPLSRFIADLARERLDIRFALSRLAPAETETLVEVFSGTKPLQAAAMAIHRETEGNPFFVLELVRDLRGNGLDLASPGEVPGVWRVPGGVRAVIGKRLARLSGDCRRLLEAAAVLGDGFEFELAAGVCENSPGYLMGALEQALVAGMLVEEGGRYRFGHPLIRRTIYDGLSLPRRQGLHLRAAEAIETAYSMRIEPHLAALASHFGLAASVPVKTFEYSRLAAEQAEAQAAWAEAARHYEACLALVEASRQMLAEDEADLLLALGRTAQNAAAWPLAWRSLKRAIDTYRSRGDGVGVARASLLAITQSSAEQQEGLRREALAALGDDHPHLRALLLTAYYADSWSEEGERDCQEAAALALQHGYEDVEVRLRDRASHKAITELRFDDAKGLARESCELIDKLGGHLYALHHLVDLATVTVLLGELAPARQVLLEALEYVEKRRLTGHSARLRAQLGWLGLLQSDCEHLASSVEPAIGSNEDWAALLAGNADTEGDARAAPPVASFRSNEDVAVLLARTAEVGGDARRALSILDEARVGASSPVRVPAALRAGDVEGAREALRQWLVVFQESAETIIFERVTALALVGDCLAELGSPEEVAPVYARAAAWTTVRTGFEGGLDHVRGALALRLGLVDEAEQWYSTGLAWAEREHCPVEQGRCLEGLAEVATRRHRRRIALRLLDEATAHFDRYGAKLYLERARARREAIAASGRRPLTTRIATHPDGITDREIEVLRLIAGGRSNREIAEQLVLSVRTVGRHITNIYAKIGARGKADATAYALRHHLV